jgi:hypothetical protein
MRTFGLTIVALCVLETCARVAIEFVHLVAIR